VDDELEVLEVAVLSEAQVAGAVVDLLGDLLGVVRGVRDIGWAG
jgi:hypothetical protein